jgi:hypothetical protein
MDDWPSRTLETTTQFSFKRPKKPLEHPAGIFADLGEFLETRNGKKTMALVAVRCLHRAHWRTQLTSAPT